MDTKQTIKAGEIFKDTYCVKCDMPVDALLVEYPEKCVVRGDEIEMVSIVATCPHCGEIIADTRVENQNTLRLYDIYRKRHNLLLLDEIKQLRSSYNLSVREFSKFLGFGEQTYARFESGELQTAAYDQIMRSAMTYDGTKHLLECNKDNIRNDSIKKIESYIENLMQESVEYKGSIELEPGKWVDVIWRFANPADKAAITTA